MSGVELIPRREQDLVGGFPDYAIWAGAQLIGRIYQRHAIGGHEYWFWGINAVTCDPAVGVPTHSHNATSMADALASFRAAFEAWLEWAKVMPAEDLRFKRVQAELEKIGVLGAPTRHVPHLIDGHRGRRSEHFSAFSRSRVCLK